MSGFDLEVFPGFRDLLIALTPYAQKSGYRFRLSDMGVSDFVLVGEADAVTLFQARLSEPELLAELTRAARLTEQEGLRNVMIATCKELRLWPPSSPDRLESIAYSDTSEPLESIAWALYNHDRCLAENAGHKATCRTANFLVDFGHACGALDVSGTSKAGSKLLTDFLAQAKVWTNDHMLTTRVRETVLDKLREFADPSFVAEIEQWLDKHWEAVAVGTIALVAGFLLAAIAIGKRK